MPRRKWTTWPRRFNRALGRTSGIVGVVGLTFAAVGASVSAPVLLVLGGLTACGSLLYAGVQGIPPKLISAEELVGTDVPFTILEEIDKPILKLGIVGYTQSGKTTFLRTALHQPSSEERTNDMYARVLTLQTKPTTYVALLDGDGEQYPQQFAVAENADFLLVFIDHNDGNDKTAKSNSRIEEHNRFLEQLEYYIRNRRRLLRLHIVLNKRDLWENSKSAEELKEWLLDHVQRWERANIADTITSDIHSNRNVDDNNKIIRQISKQAGAL